MRIHREYIFEDLGEVLPFTQIMFVVGQAIGIHPWDMQEAIERSKQKTSPNVGIVRLGDLRRNYESGRKNMQSLPDFDELLEKVAWIVAAPDDALRPDRYLDRMNSAINEYRRRCL